MKLTSDYHLNGKSIFESLYKLTKYYYIFLIDLNTRNVFLANESKFSNVDGYSIGCSKITNLGLVKITLKSNCIGKNTIFNKENISNQYQISIYKLKKILDNNYVLAKFIDGSQGWILGYCTDFNNKNIQEEILIRVTFLNCPYIFMFGSTIKEIIDVLPKRNN